MSYHDFEVSEQGGQPVELFTFVIAGVEYNFNSTTEVFDAPDGKRYLPKPFVRSTLNQKSSGSDAKVTIELPYNDPFVPILQDRSRDSVNSVSIVATHVDDPDGEIAVLWSGRIVERRRAQQKFKIECEPVSTYFSRSGLRGLYQRVCRHTLYKRGCNLNKESFLLDAKVASAAANILEVDSVGANPDGYYNGGMVRIKGTDISRMIMAQTGAVLTLSTSFSEITQGDDVEIFPGCDHALDTCTNKFNNTDNYGGFAWIPVKNPFGGSSLV